MHFGRHFAQVDALRQHLGHGRHVRGFGQILQKRLHERRRHAGRASRLWAGEHQLQQRLGQVRLNTRCVLPATGKCGGSSCFIWEVMADERQRHGQRVAPQPLQLAARGGERADGGEVGAAAEHFGKHAGGQVHEMRRALEGLSLCLVRLSNLRGDRPKEIADSAGRREKHAPTMYQQKHNTTKCTSHYLLMKPLQTAIASRKRQAEHENSYGTHRHWCTFGLT